MAKETKPEDVRIQAFVSQQVADRVDELAQAMGMSRNQAVSWLLECGTSDAEWFMNKVTARLAGVFMGKGNAGKSVKVEGKNA